jgi:predicted SprT family Zn-dependent metalloprotease
MIIIQMSQVPQKIDNPRMMTKKQKSIRKITRSTFSFLPPCDDKKEKKRKHTQD